MSWEISPPLSPPFLWQAAPHLRVCVYCFVGVMEDCGKSIDVRGSRPVFKFWLCNLPAVWLWACDLTCLSPTFGIYKMGIIMFTSRGYEITYMRQCVQSMHLDKWNDDQINWWTSLDSDWFPFVHFSHRTQPSALHRVGVQILIKIRSSQWLLASFLGQNQ